MEMNADTIVRLLTNSGFHGVRVEPDFVYMEDPSCILRSFEVFADFFMNLRNLILIFGIVSIARPIMNFIYGDDLFARGCRTISIPMSEMNRLLDARRAKLTERGEYDLYEEFNIYDSGATYNDTPIHEIPYSDAPLTSAGEPESLTIER